MTDKTNPSLCFLMFISFFRILIESKNQKCFCNGELLNLDHIKIGSNLLQKQCICSPNNLIMNWHNNLHLLEHFKPHLSFASS